MQLFLLSWRLLPAICSIDVYLWCWWCPLYASVPLPSNLAKNDAAKQDVSCDIFSICLQGFLSSIHIQNSYSKMRRLTQIAELQRRSSRGHCQTSKEPAWVAGDCACGSRQPSLLQPAGKNWRPWSKQTDSCLEVDALICKVAVNQIFWAVEWQMSCQNAQARCQRQLRQTRDKDPVTVYLQYIGILVCTCTGLASRLWWRSAKESTHWQNAQSPPLCFLESKQ